MNENYNKKIYSVSDVSNIDLARDNEFKLFIDFALLKYFKGNWTKAAMLSCYTHMFKKHKLTPFICEDSFLANLYGVNIKTIEKTKKEIKDEGFITTERKGLDPRKYISVDLEKVFEIYREYGVKVSSEFLEDEQRQNEGDAYPPNLRGAGTPNLRGGIYNNDNIIKKYNNIINAREGDFLRVEDNNNPIKNFEKNIPASGSPSSPKVDELRLAEEIFENRFWVLVQNKVGKEQAKQRFFQITNNCKNEKKVNEVIEGYKRYLSFLAKNKANNFNRRPKDPATFLNLKNKLWLEPWEFNEDEVVLSAGGSRIKQPKNWQDRIGVAKSLGLLDDFEQEEIREMYKAWKFIPHEAKKAIASEAVDNRLKQIDEYRKTEKERQQKEEDERKKQKNARLDRDYEDEYQSLKDVLNFDYENLEDALSHGEKALYEVVNKILEYEQQQEEKEAEIKRQQELEQKKIDAEKSKIALEEAEKDLWTYVDKTVDVNAYLEKNKKKFPNSYEKFKALFCNGETLTDVVFGDLAKDTVVDRLKNNILSFLINEMSNEEARNLYNKRNEAWTIWNKTQK